MTPYESMHTLEMIEQGMGDWGARIFDLLTYDSMTTADLAEALGRKRDDGMLRRHLKNGRRGGLFKYDKRTWTWEIRDPSDDAVRRAAARIIEMRYHEFAIDALEDEAEAEEAARWT